MDGRIYSNIEDVQRTLYQGPDWCRGYLLRRPRQQVSKGGSVKEYVNYVSMTEYGLDCQSRRSKSCVVNDGSLSTESSDWIPKYKQLSYSVYVRGSKNGRKNRADGRGKGQGHVHPCPLLTRFASSVNTAAQSYAAGFASQQVNEP